MKYITLNNNIDIPMVGFGTYDLLGENCVKSVLCAIKYGYRLIDTAKMYKNEKEVGKAIKLSNIKREELFITTKLDSNYNSYELAKYGIEESLKDLGLTYINLMLVHEPYSNSLDMYKAMEQAYKEGKIKAIGISNFRESLYKKFISKVEIIPMVNQVQSHVFFKEKELQNIMNEYGTKTQAWSPLASGMKDIFNNEVLNNIGSKYNKSAAQVALKYLIQNDMIVIPKSANENRIKENIDLFDFNLSIDDLKEIDKLDENKSLFAWYK